MNIQVSPKTFMEVAVYKGSELVAGPVGQLSASLSNTVSSFRAAQAPPLSLPLWVSSLFVPSFLLPIFPLHFWIFAAQPLTSDVPPNTSSLHFSSFLLFHTPCCTQDQHIYSLHFVFLRFAALVVINANGVVFFFKVVVI
jgi:hypothetical protein